MHYCSVFASADAVDTSLLEESLGNQFGNMAVKVSDGALAKVAQEGRSIQV